MMETRLQVRSFDSPLTIEEFKVIPRMPVFAILENLRSAFNVGSIVRTADCALVEKIFFCGITAFPPHDKLDKTALGALPYVPWEHRDTAVQCMNELKNRGVQIVALETTNQSRIHWEFPFLLPTALVLGNEALGVSEDALKLADHIVEIPMLGYKNSINVAVAFGIVLYEIQRQHRQRLNLKRVHSESNLSKR
jgi:tRNA G18 (ribose-2'-O)-methylase SpoU